MWWCRNGTASVVRERRALRIRAAAPNRSERDVATRFLHTTWETRTRLGGLDGGYWVGRACGGVLGRGVCGCVATGAGDVLCEAEGGKEYRSHIPPYAAEAAHTSAQAPTQWFERRLPYLSEPSPQRPESGGCDYFGVHFPGMRVNRNSATHHLLLNGLGCCLKKSGKSSTLDSAAHVRSTFKKVLHERRRFRELRLIRNHVLHVCTRTLGPTATSRREGRHWSLKLEERLRYQSRFGGIYWKYT